MFNGAHVVIYSSDAEKDRTFLRDIVGLRHVDVGQGWLIFALPPAEIAAHPHSTSVAHDFYFMCDDVLATRAQLESKGVSSAEPVDEGWGVLSSFTLPGGSTIGFYQPRHDRP